MMKILLLTIAAWPTVQAPAIVHERQHEPHMQASQQLEMPRLTAKRKAWFERAVDHILQGE